MRIFYILTLGLLFLGSACKTQQAGSQDVSVSDEQKKVVSKHLGSGDISFDINESKEYVLCMQNPEKNVSNPRQEKQYVVLDLNSGEVVYKGRLEAGYVKWYDADNLEILNEPGTMPKEMTRDDFTIIYNVKTKEKQEKKDLDN